MAKNAVATQAQRRPIDVFKQNLELAAPTIMHMVPAHIGMDKFKAMMVTSVAYNPKLLECTTNSLLRATAEAAELGLSLNPSLREADILPVYNKKAGPEGKGAMEAQMRPRFMGLMKLAKQSNEISKIEAHVVYENDTFDYQYGIRPIINHLPFRGRSRRQIIRDLWKELKHEPTEDVINAAVEQESPGLKTHAYCVWSLKDGTEQFEVMTADEIESIRNRSQAKDSGPWVTDEAEMWRKTVVRRASKYMPMSTEEFKRAVAMDDAREVGEDVPFDAGYMDVTDAPEPPQPSDAGAKQVDKLADKVAKKTGATSDPVPAGDIMRMDPPDDMDGDGFKAWADAAMAAVAKLTKSQRIQWVKLHGDVLDAGAALDDNLAQKVRVEVGYDESGNRVAAA